MLKLYITLSIVLLFQVYYLPCSTNPLDIAPDIFCSTFDTLYSVYSNNIFHVYYHNRCSDSTKLCENTTVKYFNYNQEANVCKQCFDGRLANREIEGEYDSYFLIYYRPAFTNKWTGPDVDHPAVVKRLNDSLNGTILQSRVNYTVVAKRHNGKMRWKIVDADRHYRLNCSSSNGSGREICITHSVCQRLSRDKCEYVHASTTNCKFDFKYGCHRYVYSRPLDSDTEFNKCNSTETKWKALRCDLDECSTCSVSQWSEWSLCDRVQCGVVGSQTRMRTILNFPCKGTRILNLEQNRNCTVEGCDELAEEFSKSNLLP